MVNTIPRLRMFAGPNGSGKSTIKSVISEDLLGIYINPDEIQSNINNHQYINFTSYQIETSLEEVSEFLKGSFFSEKILLNNIANDLVFKDNKLYVSENLNNSYLSSVVSDFIRQKLLISKKTYGKALRWEVETIPAWFKAVFQEIENDQ